MKYALYILILCVSTLADSIATAAISRAPSLHDYNVVWDSPSNDEHGSMPIGNGDLAANVWVGPDGDLVFYLSKSDAWSGDQNLLKLGRVRVCLDQPLLKDGAVFKQELDLKKGRIVIESSMGDEQSTIVFWIDANQSVVNVEINGSNSFNAEVTLESWRTADAPLWGGAQPDTLLPFESDTIRWLQRNEHSIFNGTLTNQNLGDLVGEYSDPLIHLTFGGSISGKGLEAKDAQTLVTSNSVNELHIRIHALTAQTQTQEEWVDQLAVQRSAVEGRSLEDTRQEHEAWWADFWGRSHILVRGNADAENVTRAYVLQRWIQAGAGRGAYPIKFNGSLFTVAGQERDREVSGIDEKGPDYRRWGGCYWFQNTREPYWAMLYSGDYDQMMPLFKMYEAALPLLKERTQTYFKHDGAFLSETMHPWGLNSNYDFGIGNQDVIPTNPYIRYYWDSGNELSMMMLDFYQHTNDDVFASDTLLPIVDEVVKFYDLHHDRTEAGTVHFSPAMSLETWHEAEDPTPVIIGLDTVLTRLLGLPENLTTAEQRARWARFRSELPVVPMGEDAGKQWIQPAHAYSDPKNSENPELYAVFPYRAYGVDKPDLDVALETWQRRRIKRTGGWSQDAIQAAMLGLTEQAKAYVVQNAVNRSPIAAPVVEPRFPAFWGPNFDWTPDQCHGSVTLIALQRMLLQCDGDSIRLLPAWPKEWDVDFKLHAPQNTTVEGRVEGGKIVELAVHPASRKRDIVYESSEF